MTGRSHMNTYQGWGTSQGKIIPSKRHFASLIFGIIYIFNAFLWNIFNYSLLLIMGLSFLLYQFNPVCVALENTKLTTKDKY